MNDLDHKCIDENSNRDHIKLTLIKIKVDDTFNKI